MTEAPVLKVFAPPPDEQSIAAITELAPTPASESGFFPPEAKLGSITAGGTVAKREESKGNRDNLTMPMGAKKVIAREREKQALALRRGAATYDQIAQSIGVSTGSAFRIVKRALKRVVHQTDYSAKSVVALELQRLDQLYLNAWGLAFGKETSAEIRLKASAELRALMDRRAKYLSLDYPALQVTEPEDVIAARSLEPIIRGASTEQLLQLQAMYAAIADGKALPETPALASGETGKPGETPLPPGSVPGVSSQIFDSTAEHEAKPVVIQEAKAPSVPPEDIGFDPAESLGVDPRARLKRKAESKRSAQQTSNTVPDWASYQP